MLKPPLPSDEASRLDALRAYDVLDTPAEAAFDDLTRLASYICGTPMAMVSLIDADRQWYKSRVGTEIVETPRDVAFCAHAILQTDVFVVSDATADARFHDNPLVEGEPHVRFYAGAPLITPDGHALGTICAVDRKAHTLTEEQREALGALARQAMDQLRLRRNLKELQELETLRDSLTHMIVHDLRTPLTALLTGLESVEMLGELNTDQAELLGISTQGGQTLLRMINDLLDISKLEDGSLTLDRAEIAVAEIVKQALQQVRPLAAEKSIALVTDLAEERSTVQADEEKFVRVLVNLLGNAIKFTPAEGHVTLGTRREARANDLLFSVSDTGEGIPAEAFTRIFEKFGQVESRKAGRRASTGLGLTFCKMVVEAHGGQIWVESELGRGSTFFCRLPG